MGNKAFQRDGSPSNWAADQARHHGRGLLLVCLIARFSSALFGQVNTADISGNITDPNWTLVPEFRSHGSRRHQGKTRPS
jgi:hypothetical protein